MGFFPLFEYFSAIFLQNLAKTPTFYVKKVRIPNHLHWSSVKGKSSSIESISTRFVKLFIDIKLDFDIDFSLSAQNLSLIFSTKSRYAGTKIP
jgi:hypothetical protein